MGQRKAKSKAWTGLLDEEDNSDGFPAFLASSYPVVVSMNLP
jgi:hypothetical protein